ncbi:MAG: hypothetical protein QM813_20200 [Verrucomicrobiota bacterium]
MKFPDIFARVLVGGTLLLNLTTARADELNERFREARQREEGMYNAIENVNKNTYQPSWNPAASRGNSDYWQRRNAEAEERAVFEQMWHANDPTYGMSAEQKARYERKVQAEIEAQKERALTEAHLKYLAQVQEHAEGGNREAAAIMARIYLSGNTRGVSRDLKLAEHFYDKVIYSHETKIDPAIKDELDLQKLILYSQLHPKAASYGDPITEVRPYNINLAGVYYLEGKHEWALSALRSLKFDPDYPRATELLMLKWALLLQSKQTNQMSMARQLMMAGWMADNFSRFTENFPMSSFTARIMLDFWNARPELASPTIRNGYYRKEQFSKFVLGDVKANWDGNPNLILRPYSRTDLAVIDPLIEDLFEGDIDDVVFSPKQVQLALTETNVPMDQRALVLLINDAIARTKPGSEKAQYWQAWARAQYADAGQTMWANYRCRRLTQQLADDLLQKPISGTKTNASTAPRLDPHQVTDIIMEMVAISTNVTVRIDSREIDPTRNLIIACRISTNAWHREVNQPLLERLEQGWFQVGYPFSVADAMDLIHAKAKIVEIQELLESMYKVAQLEDTETNLFLKLEASRRLDQCPADKPPDTTTYGILQFATAWSQQTNHWQLTAAARHIAQLASNWDELRAKDGEAACRYAKLYLYALNETNSAIRTAVHGALGGRESKRYYAIEFLATLDPARALELAQPLAAQGDTNCVALVAKLKRSLPDK